ncbi:dUTP diphosphatase [Paenibacillus massiliensis]|uniref:dUTP diphosphatase n=1 Tax=Paenibacillus massiliensis TaxID=225917 RepID=UPI00041C35DB|nr:dUTP diphosphatase [Paenibacillus massiliensis]
MSLSELFEMQRVLDERIVKEKGLEGQELLPQKILALQVELGECANEWRGFKFWSDNQRARTWQIRNVMLEHGPSQEHYSPLLEEYIDCLHFILSIGIELGIVDEEELWDTSDIVPTVSDEGAIRNFQVIYQFLSPEMDVHDWFTIIEYFIGLGQQFGFPWNEIEEAYKAKNAINHERQDTGY